MSKEDALDVTVKRHVTNNPEENAVNKELKLPLGEQFEKDLTEIMDSDIEASGETVVIALIDLDKFLGVNKEFGTQAGDKVLIDTGKYLQSKIRKDSLLYRIGGDEFAIIFRGTEEREEIFLELENIRREYNVKCPDGRPVSITIGMATAYEDAGRCPELVRKAESALYRAKVGGSNRVAMAKEEKMIPKTSHYTQDQLQRLAKLAKKEGVGEAILLREALDVLLKKYDNI